MDITAIRIAPVVRSLFSEPEVVEGRKTITSAMFLVGLLVAVIPTIAVSTGISLLVLVGAAGVVYAVTLILTDRIFEGLCGAVFVLCTFGADLPLLKTPIGASFVPSLSVAFVDIAAVPLAVLFVLWGVWDGLPTERRIETVAGYALAGFAVWAVLASIVSNGPSRSAALFFAVDLLRYVLLFALGATIVRYIGIRSAGYSLMIGIFGNVAFMFAETFNRGSFGLTYLGEGTKPVLDTFSIGPAVIQASMYGGFTGGSSRILVAMALLVLPIAMMGLVIGSYRQKILAAVCLFAGVLLTRISNSDAAFAALLLTAALVVVSLVYTTITTRESNGREKIDYAFGYLGTIGTGVLTYLLFSQRVVRDAVGSGTGLSGSGGAGAGGAGAGGAGGAASADPMLTEMILSIANAVPLIDTVTLPVRIREYAAAIVVGLKYPLFGLGGSNFKVISKSYGLPKAYGVHNTVLGYLAAVGIPGTVLFVTAIIAVLIVAIKQMRDSDADERLFWAMIVCGMLGFHAVTFWISAFRFSVTYMTFWAFAGAVIGSRYWSKQ